MLSLTSTKRNLLPAFTPTKIVVLELGNKSSLSSWVMSRFKERTSDFKSCKSDGKLDSPAAKLALLKTVAKKPTSSREYPLFIMFISRYG